VAFHFPLGAAPKTFLRWEFGSGFPRACIGKPAIRQRGHWNGRCLHVLSHMALDPYRRNSQPPYRPGIDDPPKNSRVPWIMGAIGFIAILGIVYNLSVSGFSGKPVQLSDWIVQAPP
jgi:hypothetical protein